MCRLLSLPGALVALALGFAALSGCARQGAANVPEKPEAAVPPAAPAAVNKPFELARLDRAADDKGQWTTVKGQVVWAGGDVPVMKAVTITKDEEHCKSKGDVLSEEWVVNPKNKGIRWVAVYLMPQPVKEGEKPTPLPIHPTLQKVAAKDKDVVIDQPVCKFEPHVVALRAGEQNLVIKNSSPIPHNAKYGGFGNKGDNPLIPAGGKHVADDLKPSIWPVKMECSIHPWMSAWVRVYDHPYFAVTDENGSFEIKLAPAGTWRLGVWQESLGWKGGDRNGEEIVLEAGKDKELKIELKPK